MSCGGDGKELRDPFDDAEDDGVQPVQWDSLWCGTCVRNSSRCARVATALAGVTPNSVRWMSAFHDRSGPRIPSSALIDLLLAWDAPQWRLALNVANAADKTYFATCLARGDCWWGARRNVVLNITYKF